MASTSGSTGGVLAIVQAGGRGDRMDVLTRERAKPALPFAGRHRLIDFTLSMLAHAGISDVWVSVQYLAASLDAHLAHGRHWDLDRSRGGLRRMVPEEGAGPGTQSGFSHGNADDLYRMRDEIALHAPELVVVSSADHVVGTDLAAALAEHRRAGLACTLLTAEVGRVDAEHKMVLDVDAEGRVRGVREKPDLDGEEGPFVVATEIAVYDAVVLLETLERIRHRLTDRGESGDDGEGTAEDIDTGLGDIADHLLPALIEGPGVRAVPVQGYWRDAGRPEAYLAAHRDLLDGRVDTFEEPARPVLGAFVPGPPARVVDGAAVRGSLLSAGCVVEGEVVGSVLGPGARVGAGARVEDSVLLAGVRVEADAVVESALLDDGVRVERGARVGALAPPDTEPEEGQVTMLGADAVVRAGTRVEAGGRLEPGATT